MDTLFPLIFSDTDLSTLSMCELRWFRSRCQHLSREGKNYDLVAGASFAKGMEVVRKAYYTENMLDSQAIALGYETVIESMHKEIDYTFDTLKSPERMGLALITYFKRFPLDDEKVIPLLLEDGTHSIERKISVELPIEHPELKVPLIFKGRLDLLAQENQRYYTVDEKTCKAFSKDETELLKTSGQFFGYAWLERQYGIEIQAAKIRKIAIQVKETKVEEFEIPITEYAVDLWEKSMLSKIRRLVEAYKLFQEGKDFKEVFIPDFKLGCTAFYRPCPFADGCLSKYGENFLSTNFEQLHWNSETRETMPLTEYKKLLGL